jgi:hypothetical protein
VQNSTLKKRVGERRQRSFTFSLLEPSIEFRRRSSTP